MKTITPLFLLLTFLLPHELHAALLETDTQSERESVEAADGDADELVLPEREIQFEISDEEYPMQLFRADPELLQQQYMAVVQFPVRDGPIDYFAYMNNLPPDLHRLTILNGSSLIHYQLSRVELQTHGDFFTHLVRNVPEQQLPAPEHVEFFIQQSGTGYLQFRPASRNVPLSQFLILAPTSELAQQRAEALVQLFDFGLFQTIQRHVRDELREFQKGRKEREAELAKLEEQLQETEAISVEELRALKTQQRLLTVELAGTRGRIAAANRLLARTEPQNPNRSQIENVKVTAEIDLAGLTARENTLEEMINQAQQRVQLEENIRSVEGELNNWNHRFRRLRQISIDQFQPLPLHGGKIVVRPIKWGD